MTQRQLRLSVLTAAAFIFAGCAPRRFVRPLTLSENVRDCIKLHLQSVPYPPVLDVEGEPLNSAVLLYEFYEKRGFKPAWVTEDSVRGDAATLYSQIRRADADALNPKDYHPEALRAIFNDLDRRQNSAVPPRIDQLADLDLLLTDAFLTYGSHLYFGRIDPARVDAEWFATRPDRNISTLLTEALSTGSVTGALESLSPSHAGYKRLRGALLAYRNILQKGGWHSIPNGPPLKVGSKGARVLALRARLSAEYDLPRHGKPSPVFDRELRKALARFQRNNGLDADGIMGKETFDFLNIPVEQRVEQIKLNMERWRWLPRDLGNRHLIVNIANFDLRVYEDNQEQMRMKVIIGRKFTRTPVFSANMTYLVLNPHWNVPDSVATEKILPKIQADPTYLEKMNIELVEGKGDDEVEIDPTLVDWSSMTVSNFYFRLRQKPGPYNSLGRIKFMFPNKFAVYLHDTPERELFQKRIRDFSSGCIRVEKPLELAAYLLGDDPNWSPEAIKEYLDEGKPKQVKIPEPIRVHIQYWTAWVDDDGTVQFREDLYERDKSLEDALSAISKHEQKTGDQSQQKDTLRQ